MRKQVTRCAAIFVLSACGILAAHAQQAVSDTYQWSGELVSFDDSARMVTVKARLVDQDAVNDLKRFKTGERALLVWSGHDTHADAIRRVTPYTDDRKAADRFLLPVELASTEVVNQYVTVRLRVPDASVAGLKGLKPGQWVTATSSHRPSRDNDGLVSIRPYTTSSSAGSD
jgi:hypothetical protein